MCNQFITTHLLAISGLYVAFLHVLPGAVVAEWLSSWFAEQEDLGSIPGLATWIFRDWLSPASKSRYGWKIAKSTLILKTTNQPTNMCFLLIIKVVVRTLEGWCPEVSHTSLITSVVAIGCPKSVLNCCVITFSRRLIINYDLLGIFFWSSGIAFQELFAILMILSSRFFFLVFACMLFQKYNTIRAT